MSLTALTIEEQIVTTLINALSTALLVTIGGGLVAALATRRWQTRREEHELRTTLLDRAARTAQGMYITCQYTSRVLNKSHGRDNDTAKAQVATLGRLDETYLRFSADSAALETVLGAHYGIVCSLPTGLKANTTLPVFLRWHEIRDLMVVYYYCLRGNIPDDVINDYTKGYEGKHHSGLDLRQFFHDTTAQTPRELSQICRIIRRNYNKALPDLAAAMMKDRVALG